MDGPRQAVMYADRKQNWRSSGQRKRVERERRETSDERSRPMPGGKEVRPENVPI